MRVLLILACSLLVASVSTADAQDFLRGDVDGDGRVVPMLDAYRLLDYALLDGEEPGCMDAADIDNNGVVFALIDVTFLLEWAFGDGPDLDAPGTEECGEDTGDSLGCDEVPDPCPGDTVALEENEDYELVASDGSAAVGEEVTICFSLSHDGDPLIGLQFAVCHDDDIVTVKSDDSIEEGEDLEDLDTLFRSAITISGGWTCGILMNALTESTLDSDSDSYLLYEVTYLGESAGTVNLEFCDTIDDRDFAPRVYTIDDEILPSVTHGTIQVKAPDPDYVLGLSSASGFVDETAKISVTLDNTGSPLEGYRFAVCNGTDVDLDSRSDIVDGVDLEELDLSFQTVEIFEGGWNVSMLFKVENGETLAAEEGQELYQATYLLLEEGRALLEFCTNGLDPAEISVIADDEDILPVTTCGTITVLEDTGTEFLRGDCDGNGVTFALLDAIYVLRWQFLEGDSPLCLDAADVDDSGNVSGLVDAMFLLNYGFNYDDPPPDPGPDSCGDDETDDQLGCETPPDTCS